MQKIKHHFQRFEIKYQIPLEIVEGLIPEFLKYMEVDAYAVKLPKKEYTVASLYYDSAGLDCYWQKLAGVRTRKKLRIRFYPLGDNFDLQKINRFFLEIKRKYDMVVVKDRVDLDYKNCYNLLRKNQPLKAQLDSAEQKTFDEFFWLKNYNSMLPQNLVIYQRKPFVSKIDPNFRVTIDYDLRTSLSDWLNSPKNTKEYNSNIAILEVKFNNILPFWFQQIIQRYNLEYRPFSKYCTCLTLCKPELNVNNN